MLRLQFFPKPKINNFRVTIAFDKNIQRTNISMKYTPSLKMRKTIDDLLKNNVKHGRISA